MAVVIPLAPHRRAQPSEAPADIRQEPATILFFTGVRYERQAEPATSEPTVRRSRRAMAAPPAVSPPKRSRKATSARLPA